MLLVAAGSLLRAIVKGQFGAVCCVSGSGSHLPCIFAVI